MRRMATGALLLPAVVLLVVGFLYPYLTMLVAPAADPDPDVPGALAAAVTDPYVIEIVARTARVAGLATLASVLFGFPVAWLISRAAPRWRALLLLAVTFPLLLSTVVRTFAWIVLLGGEGLISRTLQGVGLASGPVQLLYTETAMVLGLTQLFMPLLILTAYSSLASVDPALEDAARGMGAGNTAVFARVVFPLALPGTAVGAILVFAGSVTAFTTPSLLGGTRNRTLATLLYQEANTSVNWSAASAVAIIMTVVLLVVTLLLSRVSAIGARR
ncbi:ABC transporter permease [Pseudonocardia nematodicida]|uniref:ABC transporter permease n=1 Tax=Pseudonocardia nematodicida TaxID=1206997 RepID=A0ABV1K760_9PSEU